MIVTEKTWCADYCSRLMLGNNGHCKKMKQEPKRTCAYRLSGSVVRLIKAEMEATGLTATAVVNKCIIQQLGDSDAGRQIILEESQNDPVRQAELRVLGLIPNERKVAKR